MRATKIKMKPNCGASNNLLEIDSLYLTGCQNDGYFPKATVHDYLKEHPNEIQVNISPYPNLIPVISPNNEKYVKSTPDSIQRDNLLSLPRE